MTELMQASRQWASRPDDERYLDLPSMAEHFQDVRSHSKELVVSKRKLSVEPASDDNRKGLAVVGPNGHAFSPTHWSFGQLATQAGAPAGYLRSLPAPLAADNLNYGLKFNGSAEDVGVLLHKNGDSTLRAVTGPKYGRIWNLDVVNALINRFGDGRNGDFVVPGEFGREVAVAKNNTTLYASDRDMFVFLADEKHRIELPNRRDGETGTLARGFFVWNSEVGSKSIGIKTFLFDYVCCNRIVWGATDIKEVRFNHTVSAPDRFVEEVAPALEHYANGSAANVVQAIESARSKKLVGDDLDNFLANRFTRSMSAQLKQIHEIEEGRPIENLWGVAIAMTAKARGIPHQDARVDLESEAGKILKLAA